MKNAPDCHVIHATPRRVRLQIPSKRHDRSFFGELRDELSQRPGVARVDVNPATTSVVIHAVDTGTLAELLQASGLRILEAPAKNKAEPGKQMQLKKLQERVGPWVGGRTNVARVSVFLLVGASIAFKIARGNQFSAAAMLLLYGGRTVQRWWLSSREMRRALAEGALPPSLENPVENRSNQIALS